jgi:hypothetical protein
MNFDIEELNKHIAASDTDSLFVTFEEVLKQKYPELDLSNKDITLPKVKELQTELGNILNPQQSVFAKDILNCDTHYFDLKPEFIIQSAYWSGKRRYAQFLVDKEGIPIEKLVVMGLDIMKSNFPPYFKDFGEKIIKQILFSTNQSVVDEFILEFRNSINDVDWKKLIKPTGVKKLQEYTAAPPPEGKIFSTLKKKAPVNTKSSIYYNDLIKFKGWEKQYSQIQIGEKVYIVYLKANPYYIDSIAIKGYDDPPEIIELVEEYIDRNKLFDTVLKNKIEKVYSDIDWGQPIFNSNISDIFEFM